MNHYELYIISIVYRIPLSSHLLAPSIPIILRLYELSNSDEGNARRKEPAESSVT